MRVDHSPLRIWLQWYGDGAPDDAGEVSEGDVTWCRDKVFEHDLCYVRVGKRNAYPLAEEMAQALVSIKQLAQERAYGKPIAAEQNHDVLAQIDAVAGKALQAARDGGLLGDRPNRRAKP